MGSRDYESRRCRSVGNRRLAVRPDVRATDQSRPQGEGGNIALRLRRRAIYSYRDRSGACSCTGVVRYHGRCHGPRRAWWPIARRGRRSRRSMRGSLWRTLGTKTCATRNHRRLRRLLAHQPAAQQHTEYGLRRTPISRFGGQDARFSLSIKRWEASQVVNTATSPGRETSPGYVIAQIR